MNGLTRQELTVLIEQTEERLKMMKDVLTRRRKYGRKFRAGSAESKQQNRQNQQLILSYLERKGQVRLPKPYNFNDLVGDLGIGFAAWQRAAMGLVNDGVLIITGDGGRKDPWIIRVTSKDAVKV